MSLTPGTRLGPYEIGAALGAGGMGEVYAARDTRLDRSVAVKILPAAFASDVQLKLRFEREAKTISRLNHPNICTLYDVGQENGTDYLVLELVEGETLSDRLARGPLPLPDVLRYGAEIAEALDKAHQHDIVHRDLKPGNVMVTRTGAKLLDFGLARGGVIEMSPEGLTQARSLTAEGTIVGTFQYMAPEQLEGIAVDPRTDIFALGAVLYEMATGQRAFQGKTKTSLIAAIVASQPAPVSQVQPLAPTALDHVIERCLAKDPADRWQSARDVAAELRWIALKGSQAGVAAPVAAARRWRERVAWTAAAIAVLVAGGLGLSVAMRPPVQRIVTEINPPENTRFASEASSAVLSPDGQALAFVAASPDGQQSIWVRRLSTGTAQRLAGTDGGGYIFWSPDSRHLGFFAAGSLKRVEVAGGPAERLADAPSGRGGTWGSRETIVFAPSTGGSLQAVSASGGEVREVTKIGKESSHRVPSFLPDGVHFLYLTQHGGTPHANVWIGSTEGGPARSLMSADAAVMWSGTGHILFVRDGILRARPFDPDALTWKGEAVTVAEDVQVNRNFGMANFSASDNGLVSYGSGESANARLAWYGREGKEGAIVAGPGDLFDPRISPDGKTIAYAIAHGTAAQNIYLHDVTRRVQSRFTFGKADEWGPMWSPDGRLIAFTSFGNSPGNVHVKASDGTGEERKLVSSGWRAVVSDWPRQDLLIYHSMVPKTSWDIMIYSFRDGRSRTFLSTPFGESSARLSPDGKWIAYASNESGRYEVYVRSFEGVAAGKWQVSSAGAHTPLWSRDGRELFFSGADGKVMVVSVQSGQSFAAGIPEVAVNVQTRMFAGLTRPQFWTADGKTFLVNSLSGNGSTSEALTLVQNWQAGR